MKSTPGTTLAEKPSMSRVKLALRVRPTGPLVLTVLYSVSHLKSGKAYRRYSFAC